MSSEWHEENAKDVHVSPDVTSDMALTAFTQGDCWILAICIAEITGWELVTFGATMDNDDEWDHCAVLTPDGNVLDITGVSTPEEALQNWGGEMIDTDADLIKEHVEYAVEAWVPWDCARRVASVLVWQYENNSPVQALARVV